MFLPIRSNGITSVTPLTSRGTGMEDERTVAFKLEVTNLQTDVARVTPTQGTRNRRFSATRTHRSWGYNGAVLR